MPHTPHRYLFITLIIYKNNTDYVTLEQVVSNYLFSLRSKYLSLPWSPTPILDVPTRDNRLPMCTLISKIEEETKLNWQKEWEECTKA
jgi:hypothetical protein